MTNISAAIASDMDDDDDDNEFFDDFDWEDNVAFKRFEDELPPGWVILKIEGYSATKLEKIRQWCTEHCDHAWDTVGWSSGCSYSVAIKFASKTDAAFYRLTW